MKSYFVGSQVVETIPLIDDAGNPVIATGVTYRVFDEQDNNVVELTPLSGFVSGASDAVVSVTPAQNTLPAGALTGLRTIELLITTASGTLLEHSAYVLVAGVGLVKGQNSYQTFSQALLGSLEISNLAAWAVSSERARISALIEAHSRLGRLRYSIKSKSNAQNMLSTASEINNMAQQDAGALARLPAEFIQALHRAQIVEADAVLGGDPIDEQRRAGLMSTSIGEVSQMYRPGAPLIMAVSARALRYLTGYVKFGLGVGRSS